MSVIVIDLAPTPDQILDDPVYSDWLKAAAQDMPLLDPETAFNDAEELRNVMVRQFAETVASEGEYGLGEALIPVESCREEQVDRYATE